VAIRVERARPEDGPTLLRLIADSGLPPDGLLDHLDSALKVMDDGRTIGCAALEIYPDGALLRSVAVERAMRGTGIGQLIVRAALELARERGATSVYLLTTTAEAFFERFGFKRVSRADVPAGVRASAEFRYACPESAVAMARYPSSEKPVSRRPSSSSTAFST
jgi:amino-acid N-acetyltransferase